MFSEASKTEKINLYQLLPFKKFDIKKKNGACKRVLWNFYPLNLSRIFLFSTETLIDARIITCKLLTPGLNYSKAGKV